MSATHFRILPSRINTVLAVGEMVVVKIAGPRFRRGIRIFSPSDMLLHEQRCLEALEDFDIAPRSLYFNGQVLVMSNCGRTISEVAPPVDWHAQIEEIASRLAERRILHLDLKAANVLSDGETLRIIDFGWSLLNGRGYVNPSMKRVGAARLSTSAGVGDWTLATLERIVSSVL